MNQLIFLLRPTAIESFFYLFAVLAGLFIGSFDAVLSALFDGSIREEDLESTDGVVDGFVGSFDESGLSATITTLIFWSAAGAVIYMIIWAIGNGFLDFYKDAKSDDQVVQGRSSKGGSELKQGVSKLVFRITALISMVAYLLIFVKLLTPLWLSMFGHGVTDFASFDGFFQVVGAVAGGLVSLHMFTILARLTSMKMRVYGDYGL